MNWFNAKTYAPAASGLYLVHCGMDDDNLPVYFLSTFSDGTWFLDESGDAIEIEVCHWSPLHAPPSEACSPTESTQQVALVLAKRCAAFQPPKTGATFLVEGVGRVDVTLDAQQALIDVESLRWTAETHQ